LASLVAGQERSSESTSPVRIIGKTTVRAAILEAYSFFG